MRILKCVQPFLLQIVNASLSGAGDGERARDEVERVTRAFTVQHGLSEENHGYLRDRVHETLAQVG